MQIVVCDGEFADSFYVHIYYMVGYYPEIVLAGRRLNDRMASWIVDQLIIEMARRSMVIGGSNVLILGFTFKENCSDIRNTKVVDIISALNTYKINNICKFTTKKDKYL